jgi:hypothetical protein
MSFIAAGAAVVSAGVGVAKVIQGGVQAKKAREDAAKAKAELDKGKDMFSNIDTSNPYQNLENTMEDLTVNKQAAEFQKQQSMQGQANIMQQMRGAAGGSGIAALAQSMAQQGSMDAQKASAGIGQQEAANQKAERGMASDIQNKEREGDMLSRNMQFGKISSMMGMSAGELQGANSRLQAGQEAMMDGGKDMATTAIDYGVNTGEIDPNSAWGHNVNTNQGNPTINN